jgi:autotransporter-associated beta strand protein
MKRLIVAAICCLLPFILPAVTYAISAEWDLDPISGDWNTAANWTPMGVPNGPADIATFGLSNTTDVSISADTEVDSIIFTPAATSPYTITAGLGLTLTISGVGITNNSGRVQFFEIAGGGGSVGRIVFSKNATAGTHNVSFLNEGIMEFRNRSSAGSSDIGNEAGAMFFSGRSTAGSSTISNLLGDLFFSDHSTAGNARLFDEGGSIAFLDSSSAGNSTFFTVSPAYIAFRNNATAGSASFFFTDLGQLQFSDNATAGNASIGSWGAVSFFGSSSADRATINSSGIIEFLGSSDGGTAQIELVFNAYLFQWGSLDIHDHNAPGPTIGSLAGDEGTYVHLGANNLTVGSNNLSTTFAGVIEDFFGISGGSLTKIGTGTLILSGDNTYTGDTNVNRGVLQVDGSVTSNTFVNHRGTLAGMGTVQGNVMSNDFGIVRPGGALGAPGTLTVVHNYTQTQYATLMIQIAGANTGDFGVLNVLGNASLNGFLDPVLLSGFVPTLGDTFIFLNYASFTGAFSHIKHRVFDNSMLQWSVIYEDGHAILTVGPNTIPDHDSTFLLLALGLLGLVGVSTAVPPRTALSVVGVFQFSANLPTFASTRAI